MKRATALLLTSLVAVVAVACSSGSSPTAVSTAGGPLTVKDGWARPAPAGADTAVYLTVVNGKVAADTLVGVSTTAAQSAAMHQTSTDASGMTGMQAVPSVSIAGGATFQFAPGGYHIMLTGLKQALNVGDQVQVVLTFQNAGTVTLNAEVRAN